MKRVTGIGGIFFKSENKDKLYDWYEKHLGIARMPGNGAMFQWKDAETGADGYTLWSLFPKETKYLDPSRAGFMVNYRVDDMDALLVALKEEGIEIAKSEDSEYGRFAWIMDPEGNRIELFQPAKE
ncbi:MAG: glyoxalase [Acidobacteriales bacterium]|nr:glyoxalase [Terriglobales bacterium]